MKTKVVEAENLQTETKTADTIKKQAIWKSEELILKLLIQCIVGNYRICIDSSDGIKVWIENETPETKLDDKNKTKLIQELVRHIK